MERNTPDYLRTIVEEKVYAIMNNNVISKIFYLKERNEKHFKNQSLHRNIVRDYNRKNKL